MCISWCADKMTIQNTRCNDKERLRMPSTRKELYTEYDSSSSLKTVDINSLNTELNVISHLLTLLGAHHILHISRIRVKGS